MGKVELATKWLHIPTVVCVRTQALSFQLQENQRKTPPSLNSLDQIWGLSQPSPDPIIRMHFPARSKRLAASKGFVAAQGPACSPEERKQPSEDPAPACFHLRGTCSSCRISGLLLPIIMSQCLCSPFIYSALLCHHWDAGASKVQARARRGVSLNATTYRDPLWRGKRRDARREHLPLSNKTKKQEAQRGKETKLFVGAAIGIIFLSPKWMRSKLARMGQRYSCFGPTQQHKGVDAKPRIWYWKHDFGITFQFSKMRWVDLWEL